MDAVQLLLFCGLLLLLAKPFGLFAAAGLDGRLGNIIFPLRWIERGFYKICGVDENKEMSWREYAFALLIFQGLGIAAVYLIQRIQYFLPFNPESLANVPPDCALNTAVSFVTNTNWQSYGGESTMSYFTQMAALGVQNFLSAATGIAVFAVVARGVAREESPTIGNFWVDLTRSVIYILLPLSFVLAIALASQGVVQSFDTYKEVNVYDSPSGARQILPMGPAASQIAIKQLGTNGGGFFNVNSAHPFENPTPFSNFLEMLAILLLPAALCYTFGIIIKDRRQGAAILAAMFLLLIAPLVGAWWSEQRGVSHLVAAGADAAASDLQCGGNMEGKEARFGIVNSTIWAAATTAASNGSVNCMHDSLTPGGGLVSLWFILLGEIVFGGVGSGFYGMLMFIFITVFLAGLMVGRTPEYAGKKIGPFEMKMAAIVILIPAALVLVGTAAGVACESGKSSISNPGAHGFTQVLYAFASASNNNGSAFAGLSANTIFYNIGLAICMFLGRFALIAPVLAIGGSLAAKKRVPENAGTLPTHTPFFIILLIATILVVGALTFFPALAIGPIVEQLQMRSVVR